MFIWCSWHLWMIVNAGVKCPPWEVASHFATWILAPRAWHLSSSEFPFSACLDLEQWINSNKREPDTGQYTWSLTVWSFEWFLLQKKNWWIASLTFMKESVEQRQVRQFEHVGSQELWPSDPRWRGWWQHPSCGARDRGWTSGLSPIPHLAVGWREASWSKSGAHGSAEWIWMDPMQLD